VHPSVRVQNHLIYDRFLRDEIVPKALSETGYSKVAVAGCSFGGYHAANFAFRYPEKVGYMISMSGAFDIKPQMDGYYDDNVYYNNPPDYLPALENPALNEMGIVLGAGEHDNCLEANKQLSEILHRKGIAHWLDIRAGAIHDWPIWREMFPHYLSQIKY
jgi:esterase/lipase superfamily enzyme